MSLIFTLEVYRRQELLCRHTLERSIVIGRQERPDELLLGLAVSGSCAGDLRLAIEPLTEVEISRRQVRLRPLENGNILVEGLSERPLYPEFGLPIGRGESREFVAPFRLTFGPQRAYGLSVTILQSASAEGLQTLAHAAPAPGEGPRDRRVGDLAGLDLADVAAEELGAWLHALLEVLQSAASSSDFYQRAADAIVRLVGLHSGRVLLRDAGQWKLEAYSVDPRLGDLPSWRPSHSILEHMARQRSTIWKDTSLMSLTGESLIGMQAIVAAPICNRAGEVIGALYGDRRRLPGASPEPCISKLEAQLVETLAFGVAVGLERLAQERAATEQRVRFEQFFSSQLAEELARHPDLLDGQDADVSILFCDVRGFSRIAQNLGTRTTVTWISDVMGTLSECVQRHEGVVVDYIGDALIAMWGAPVAQSDHAARACRASLDMLRTVPELNRRWSSALSTEMDVAIGINSGVAQVGNIGSRYKFKYGPLGHSVNLASRVQGLNKYFKTRLLVTGATFERLSVDFAGRRLCAVRVMNIDAPVDLYEVFAAADERTRTLFPAYEQALREFESQQFHRAAATLGSLLPNCQDDGPTHVLLARTVECILNPPHQFDAAWTAPGK